VSRLPALVLAAWAALPLPWDFHPPQWVERLLYNARERDAVALERYRQGDRKGAVGPADTALRLDPQDPLTAFNAGTVHLAAGDARGAVKLLEPAAAKAPPGLRGKAWYNLGNARLAARDAAGAVEAYKQALRAEPGDADAKFNLELALRERERERLRTRSPRDGSRGDRGGGQESSEAEGRDQPGEKQEPSPAQDPQAGAKNRPQDGQDKTVEQGQPSPQDGRRPFRFHDQPEMTAAEAAALLQSVENLEREQRRAEAARRSRERAADGKDW
jgi:Ca-activated chloride channel family protein